MLLAQAAAEPHYIVITSIVTAGSVIITALIKFTPRKVLNGEGQRLVTKVEYAEMQARVPVLEKAFERETQYTHEAVHDLSDRLQNMQLKQALANQKLDDICDHLRIKRRYSPSGDSDPNLKS